MTSPAGFMLDLEGTIAEHIMGPSQVPYAAVVSMPGGGKKRKSKSKSKKSKSKSRKSRRYSRKKRGGDNCSPRRRRVMRGGTCGAQIDP